MFTGFDGFLARTVGYTTARIWGFLYFYDWLNPDPRRTARMDWYIMAGMAGGMVAGVASNPIDLVFSRMQVDELYPDGYRRNYKSFVDGLMKASEEGVLLRGAVANGLRIGALCASMTGVYDWCKENSYFMLGPSWITDCGQLLQLQWSALRLHFLSMPFVSECKQCAPYQMVYFHTARVGIVLRRSGTLSQVTRMPATQAVLSMPALKHMVLDCLQFAT